jgi:hypothetical protein
MTMKYLILLIMTFAKCTTVESPAEVGTLYGTAVIGPLCGIVPANMPPSDNPCGFTDAQMDNAYGYYKVVAKTRENDKVVAEKKLDRTGQFSFELPIGEYKVNIEPNTLGVSTNKDQIAIITKDNKVRVAINFQTGQR